MCVFSDAVAAPANRSLAYFVGRPRSMMLPRRKPLRLEESNFCAAGRRVYALDRGRLDMRRAWPMRTLVPQVLSIPLGQLSKNPQATLTKIPLIHEHARMQYSV